MQNFFEKCDIYFEGSLISKELLIKSYVDFISSSFGEHNRTVGVVLHTGSICFDIMSLLTASFGSLILDASDADNILSSINLGEMVQYKNNRFFWGGFGKFDGKDFSSVPDIENATHILLIQKKSDKYLGESISKTMLPLSSKNLIAPYNGNSGITDGRGLRRGNSNRMEFLTYLFGMSSIEITSVLSVSSVVVAQWDVADRIVKGLTISYGEGKTISLLDIVTISYYTEGEEYHYAGNPGRNDPVLKITGKMSTARDMILDKSSNKVIGLLVLGSDSISKGKSELVNLLNRKSLQYIYLSTNIDSENVEEILNECEGASIFACTKEYLVTHSMTPIEVNRHTTVLNKQVENIINKKINTIIIPGSCTWEEYRIAKETLYFLRKYEWNAEEKDFFIINAYSLLNLFTTAVFSIEKIEEMVSNEKWSGRIVSPRQRIRELWKLADKLPEAIVNRAIDVIGLLESMYIKNEIECLKYNELIELLCNSGKKRVAVIVPKAYYSDILEKSDLLLNGNITIVTANKFDNLIEYDKIIVVGDISGKRFDTFRCRATSDITVLLYDFESRLFRYKEKVATHFECELNKKTEITSESDAESYKDFDIIEIQSENDDKISEFTFIATDLDYYIEKMGGFDIKTLIGQASTMETTVTAEIVSIGTFLAGEQILFSKNYKAFVLDKVKGTVVETDVGKLEPGDILVFTRRDDFTRNMVDNIFDNLLSSGRLSESVTEAAFKSGYWKLVLEDYMVKYDCSYRDVSKRLSALGCKRHEVTIKAWLSDDYRIIGPLDEEAFVQIAILTNDPDMKQNPKSFFEACRVIRHERREILNLVGRAIIDKLRGKLSNKDHLLDAVYDNIDKLAYTLELESVTELAESFMISINMINKPLPIQEV
jgi:hypothetical protein